MNMDSFTGSVALSGKLTPTEQGIIGTYRVGTAGHSIVLPAACNMFASRSISFAASATHTLHVDDFAIDAESTAWKNVEGGDVALVTLYAIMFVIDTVSAAGFQVTVNGELLKSLNDVYLATTIGGKTTAALDYVITETGGAQTGTVKVIAFGKNA